MSEIGYETALDVNNVAIYRATSTNLLRNSVPVHTGANQKWYSVLRVRFDNLYSNQLFDCMGSVEITNDTGHQVNCVSKIIVNSNYDDEPGENGAFIISAGGGGNTSTSRHHELLLRPAVWVPDQTYGQRNITLMVRAVSSAAQGGDTVSLTSSPAELVVKRWSDMA